MDNFGNILDPVLDNFCDTVGGFHVGAHGHFQLDADHALVLLRHDFHRHVVGGHIAHEKEHGDQGDHLEQHSRNGKAERQGFQIHKADAVEGSGEQPENASHHGGLFFDNVSVLVFLFALEQIGRQKRGQGKGGEQGHQGGKHHGKTEGTEEDTGDGFHEGDRHEHAHVSKRRCHDSHHDFGGSLVGCLFRIQAFVQFHVDIFKHHDGVGHQQAHRRRQCHQGHHVDAESSKVHQGEGSDHGGRHGEGRNEHGGELAEEQEQESCGKHDSDNHVLDHVVDGFVHCFGLVVHQVKFETFGEALVDGVHAFDNALGNVHHVGVGTLFDIQGDRTCAVETGNG